MAQVIPKGMKFYENSEKELEKAFKEYEDRFGKGSVDRMMPLVDLLNPDPVADMKAIPIAVPAPLLAIRLRLPDILSTILISMESTS